MSAHRFQDEWLVKAASAAGGAKSVEAARAAAAPRLADALIAGGLSAEDLCKTVTAAFSVRAVARAPKVVDRLAVSLVPEKLCRRHKLVPLCLRGDDIELAMANPLDVEALSDVQAVTGRQPVAVYMPPSGLDELTSRSFDPEFVVYDLLERFNEPTTVELLGDAPTEVKEDVRAPVIRLVNAVIARAVMMKASDIHLEHDERASVVRLRVDGALRNLMTLPRHLGAGAVVSRIKIMADLDISDHMRPQDGRAKLRVGAAEVGLRVSTLPTSYGEKAVIRILDKRAAEVPFDALGFRPPIAERLARMTGAAQGFVLVTGPTGSGKTTTLYSLLNRIKREDTNVVTIEDPIEYKLDGINQVQVQEKQGLTFAAALRSVLRQDPDVILVGEIRDRETAEIALQAAQTGHLVFSTLHTNDSISAITRLADMGIERFKLAPALLGVTAQRLVRRLCSACRQELSPAEIPGAVAAALEREGLPAKLSKARGCADCDFVGYKGRVAVVEVLEFDEALGQAIAGGADDAAVRRQAVQAGRFVSLSSDALARLADGTTSLEEAGPIAKVAEAEPAKAKPAAPAASTREAPPAGAAGRRVLVVDDDATIRLIVRGLLQKAGYAVREAPDGAAALEAIVAETPDLLMVDLQMPGLDGKSVIRGVRQSLGLGRLPILVLTADSDDASQAEVLALGADDYVVKPVKPPVLLARVNAVFRRSAARE